MASDIFILQSACLPQRFSPNRTDITAQTSLPDFESEHWSRVQHVSQEKHFGRHLNSTSAHLQSNSQWWQEDGGNGR